MSGSRTAAAPPNGPPGPELSVPTRAEPTVDREPGSEQAAAAEQAGAFLKRPEVRDVLAWMRLLVDPQDAVAVVRALARPPIELRQVELARVIQVARRRKLDLVLGLAAATEAPQVPPETRERIQRFLQLHRAAAAQLDTLAPDAFIAQLIERLGVRSRALLAPDDTAQQRASLELLHQLAVKFVAANPNAGTRDLARHLATVVPVAPSASSAEDQSPDQPGDQRQADDTSGDGDHAYSHPNDQQSPQEPTGRLADTLQLLREEVLDGVTRIGGRLGELRLDTDLDISHGVVRYLELLKLSAVLQRPDGQSLADALADANVRLLAAATPLQREILLTSTLDDMLLAADGDVEGDQRARAQALAPRDEHSLEPFLPRRGIGLALSASDIHTYRACPLRYKFARVLRIPTEQTIHQRFGIVVHQVLERYHCDGGQTLAQMLDLLDARWRRAGFGDSQRDRELREKAHVALTRYHAQLQGQDSQPVWFERQFDFRLGPHHVRGRVDRVDRVGEGYELIDYKTSRPKTAEQLRDDIQLSLYALAAREDWGLECSQQAYYYVLDDLKVPVERDERDAEAVKDVVLEVGEGILAQAFDATPSPVACGMCDYRIVCPAAEV
ncbi:MAG TPA: PD-(D/E)XK nuclease family protein [Solirubrobacteraceae bacterium]|nr:PD-(D/E)XK nuclease family protein [Solirubrobacteraceae bacterium]